MTQHSEPPVLWNMDLKMFDKTCSMGNFICSSSKIETPKFSLALTCRFTCNSASVVYIITCDLCLKSYVGQTGRRIKDRIREHIYYIKKGIEATGEHFSRPNHSISNMTIQIIEEVNPKSRILRETRELMWIQHFNTIEPNGLNRKE